MDLKDNNDVGKIFFIFSHFSSKGSIELYAMVDQSLEEILVLLCKPRKLRFVEEIIALMYGSMVTISSDEVDNSM